MTEPGPSDEAELRVPRRASRPDVLFIGGCGRSGSTLLGSLLAQRPGTLNVGELYYVWDRGLTEHWLCGCGDPVEKCELWSHVVESAGLQRSPEFLTAVRDRYLRSGALRRLSRLGEEHAPTADLADLATATEAILRSALDLTGADLVVDSSKRAGAALLLHWFTSLDVRVVHLVRDPRATVFSQSRPKANPADGRSMPKKSTLGGVLTWLQLNWAIDHYVAQYIPTLRVRYEELVSDPDGTLDQIWAFADIDPCGVTPERVVEHTVSGNPSRFLGSEIVPDMQWIDRMPTLTKRLVTALSLPLLHRYGYPMRTGSG